MTKSNDQPANPQCAPMQQRISDYLSRSLSAADTTILQQHLPTCPTCSATLAAFRSFDQQIAALPNLPAANRVRAGVLRAIADVEARRQDMEVRANPRGPGWAVSLAAMVMLLGFAGLFSALLGRNSFVGPQYAYASPSASTAIGFAASAVASPTPIAPTITAHTGESLTGTATTPLYATPVAGAALVASIQPGETTTDSLRSNSYLIASVGPGQPINPLSSKISMASLPATGANRAAYLVRGAPKYIEVVNLADGKTRQYPVPDASLDVLINADSGLANPLTASFAPDGKWLLLDGYGVVLYDLASKQMQTISPPADLRVLGWAADSQSYYLASSTTGNVYRYDLAGSGQLLKVSRSPGPITIAADSSAIYYANGSQIFRYDLSSDKAAAVVQADTDSAFSATAAGSLIYSGRDGGGVSIKQVQSNGQQRPLASLPVGSKLQTLLLCGNNLYYQLQGALDSYVLPIGGQPNRIAGVLLACAR